MGIAISCGCGKRLKVKGQFAGKKVRCPECGATITVPAPDEAEPDSFDEAAAMEDVPTLPPRKRSHLRSKKTASRFAVHFSLGKHKGLVIAAGALTILLGAGFAVLQLWKPVPIADAGAWQTSAADESLLDSVVTIRPISIRPPKGYGQQTTQTASVTWVGPLSRAGGKNTFVVEVIPDNSPTADPRRLTARAVGQIRGIAAGAKMTSVRRTGTVQGTINGMTYARADLEGSITGNQRFYVFVWVLQNSSTLVAVSAVSLSAPGTDEYRALEAAVATLQPAMPQR